MKKKNSHKGVPAFLKFFFITKKSINRKETISNSYSQLGKVQNPKEG